MLGKKIQEAYDRTGWILNVTVTGYGNHDNHRLLNYLTAPSVLIWSACLASCAIPYIYAPVNLYCKNEDGKIIQYIEGGNFPTFLRTEQSLLQEENLLTGR